MQENETPEFISVSNFIMMNVFGVSVGRSHPMCNFYSSVVCTGKRRKPRINMNCEGCFFQPAMGYKKKTN